MFATELGNRANESFSVWSNLIHLRLDDMKILTQQRSLFCGHVLVGCFVRELSMEFDNLDSTAGQKRGILPYTGGPASLRKDCM